MSGEFSDAVRSLLATGLILSPPLHVVLFSSLFGSLSGRQASALPARPLYWMPLLFLGGPHPLHSSLLSSGVLLAPLGLASLCHETTCCPESPSPFPFPVYLPPPLHLSPLFPFCENVGPGPRKRGEKREENPLNLASSASG